MVFYRMKRQRRKLVVMMNDDDSVTVGISGDNGQDKSWKREGELRSESGPLLQVI